jgi:hypothetical protein
MYENRGLRKIFETNREKVIGGCGKLHVNGVFICSVVVMKWWNVGWTGM